MRQSIIKTVNTGTGQGQREMWVGRQHRQRQRTGELETWSGKGGRAFY